MSQSTRFCLGQRTGSRDIDLPHVDKLSAGACVVTEGETSDYLYSIRSGMVRIYRTDGRDQSRTIGFLFPGDFVGVNCTTANQCRYSAETVTPTAVCRWPRHCVEALVCEVPAARKVFLSELSHEMNLLQQRMELLNQPSARKRLAAFLSVLAKRLTADLQDETGRARYPLHDTEVADYLNLSPKSFQQALRSLQKARAVQRRKRDEIEILDEPILHAFLGAKV